MAFVYRNKRFDDNNDEENYYIDYHVKPASFNEPKIVKRKNIIKKYSNKNLKKLNKLKDKEIELKQKIINEEKKLKDEINYLKKINTPNAIFKSKTQKNLLKNKDIIPGPGDYKIESQIDKNVKRIKKENFLKKNISVNVINTIKNYPSIPNNRKMNLPIDNEETDISKYNETLINYKTNVGPGSYNVTKKIGKGNCITWKKPKEKVIKWDKIGPGYYNIKEKQNTNSLNKKGSSFFLCSIPKNILPNEIINKNNEENKEFIKEANPGPGYYYNSKVTSSIKLRTVDPKFQNKNFGIDRFKVIKNNNQVPDPGYYNINDNLIKKSYNLNIKNFNYNSKRREIINNSENPGPGSYFKEKKEFVEVKKNNKIPFNISSVKMENLILNEENPGPGTYFNNKIKKFEDFIPNNSSFFKGNKKSNIYKSNNNPGPGHYNVLKKIEEEKEDDELKDIGKNNKPFNTGQIRFKKIENIEPELFDNQCEKILHNIFKGIPSFQIKPDLIVKQNRYAFNLNQDKFKDNHLNNKLNTPAFYNLETPWNKKSYNKLFN